MFQFEDEKLPAVIKVIGVGGGGSNAVGTMVQSDIKGVQFIVANTDMQALERVNAPIKLQIGSKLTCGRGAGAKRRKKQEKNKVPTEENPDQTLNPVAPV